MTSWNKRYLQLAELVASWSKDPNKKVGAVVVCERRVLGLGYNGFPKNVIDSPRRLTNKALKNKLMVHAEVNALLASDIRGDTIYIWPVLPCSQCLGLIIQAGIKHIVIPEIDYTKKSHWDPTLVLSLIDEVGLEITFVKLEETKNELI